MDNNTNLYSSQQKVENTSNNNNGNFQQPNVQAGIRKEQNVAPQGQPKKSGGTSAKTTFIATFLIIVTLGCFGINLWMLFTQIRIVEVTGTSYLCVLEEGQEKEVEQISSNTVTLSFRDEGKGLSIADVGDKQLSGTQYLKVVYEMKNVGASNISLKFEIVSKSRDNFEVFFVEDGKDDYILNSDLYIVNNIKQGESRKITFYFKVLSADHEGSCDIDIKNSFYKNR